MLCYRYIHIVKLCFLNARQTAVMVGELLKVPKVMGFHQRFCCLHKCSFLLTHLRPVLTLTKSSVDIY